MELWIRTQDKKQLLKVNDGLYIANGFTDTPDSFIGIKSIGHIGKYSTEKRALEVLDEIQNMIIAKEIYTNDREAFNDSCKDLKKGEIKAILRKIFVYEMPKE